MVQGIGGRGSRSFLLAGTSALAVGMALAQSAAAVSCSTGGDVSITAACTGPLDWTGGNLTVSNSGTIVSGGVAIAVMPGLTVGTLSNSGTISAGSGTAAVAFSNGGRIVRFDNSGLIQAAQTSTAGTVIGFDNFGTVDLFSNRGVIEAAGGNGIINVQDAGTLIGTIGTLTNSGTITGGSGIVNNATILVLDNAAGGLIRGTTAEGLRNTGAIGVLSNSGTIEGATHAIYSTGSLAAFVNSGLVSGNIYSASTLTISGGANGTVGTLTGLNGAIGTIGTLTGMGDFGGITFAMYGNSSIAFDTGALLMHDAVELVSVIGTGGSLANTATIGGGQVNQALAIASGASLSSLYNSGKIFNLCRSALGIASGASLGTLTNSGSIEGISYAINNAGSIGTVINDGLIDTASRGIANASAATIVKVENRADGTINAQTALYNDGQVGIFSNEGRITASNLGINNRATGVIEALLNSGEILADRGVLNNHFITTLTNSGTIASSGFVGLGISNSPTGSIGTLTNLAGATISGTSASPMHTGTTGIGILTAGTIGTLINGGRIEGGVTGLRNASLGIVDGISNSGTIAGSDAIVNDGTISTLVNAAGGTIHGTTDQGIANAGTIGTLSNDGLIKGDVEGLRNSSVIRVVTNTGMVEGGYEALYNGGAMDVLTNEGTIRGAFGISNDGTIVALTNRGAIIGVTVAGVANAGSIATLTNAGTIAAPPVHDPSNSWGEYALYNSGTIDLIANTGAIVGDIYTTSTLTFSGGSGTVFGTLTGGTFLGSAEFTAGNHLLDDAVAGNVINAGAVLDIVRAITITGNYGQSAGSLEFRSGSSLVVTGTVDFAGGTIVAGGSGNNYTIGQQVTLIDAGTSGNYGGVVIRPVEGVEVTTTVAGGDLVATYQNDYVGGTLASFSETGSIVGGDYGLYVGDSGSIGTLTNSGTLGGTIYAFYNGGDIGSFVNNGIISDGTGYANAGSIAVLTNNGLISGDNGLVNSGTIDLLTNAAAGSIVGTGGDALRNSGRIGTLSNAGSIGLGISGASTTSVGAYALSSTGTIAALSNTGTIGAIATASSASTAYAAGISNDGSIGTLTNSGTVQGAASGTNIGGVIASAIFNGGTIGTLTNTGSLGAGAHGSGVYDAFASGIYNSGSIAGLTHSGHIGADTDVRFGIAVGIVNDRGRISGLDIESSGTIGITASGFATANGIANAKGSIGALTNAGLITINSSNGPAVGIFNVVKSAWVSGPAGNSTIVSLANTGTIAVSGVKSAGLANDAVPTASGTATGIVGTLTNSGTITADGTGAYMSLGVGQILAEGIENKGSIVVLTNSGLISGEVGGYAADKIFAYGIVNKGGIGTLANSGTIRAAAPGASANRTTIAGISNSGNIGLFANTGVVSGFVGLHNNGGTVGTISNGGVISGGIDGLLNEGRIGTVSNGGTILAAAISGMGLANAGTIAALTNSGLLQGYNGLWNWGVINAIGNTGTINGTGTAGVGNSPGGTIGTLTNSGLVTGRMQAVANLGTLSIVNSGTIAGDILNNGSLTISGGSGGTVGTLTGLDGALATVSGNSVAFDGGALLVHASFTKTLRVTGTGGALSNTGVIDTLSVDAGASLATLSNSGTIKAGATTGAAIHNLGSIGVVSNSGMIGGTIVSASALTFAGGTAAGTLAGGAIVAPSVEFASGAVVLQEDIQGDTALTGATLAVGANTRIDGQYRQSAGILDISTSGILTITGTASITGGTVLAGDLPNTGNYIAGETAATLIDAASGSSYSDIDIVFSGIPELAAGADTSSTDDLRIVYRSDYVGGGMGSLANAGSIGGGAYGVFVAAGGSIGTFSNSGTIGGTSDAFYNGGTVGLLQNDGIISDGSGVDNAGVILTLTNSGLIEGDSGIRNTGSIGSLFNTGTITGPDFAIDNSGSLGPITNSGLISGNIRSTGMLIFAGSGGTLSGGTIVAAGVSIASGTVVLGDDVDVGTGTVANTGATLALSSRISITGNYHQDGGGLISNVTDASTYGALAVSGSADISNTTITLSGTSVRSGGTYTIVDAGSASSYTGDTLVLVGSHYRAVLTTVGDDLVASIRAVFGEVGQAKGGNAAVMGGVFDQLSDQPAMQHAIDTLSLLSDDDLGHALAQAAPAEVGGAAASLQRASLIEDLIGDAVGSRRARAGGNGWSLWQQVLGGAAARDAAAGALGYDTTAVGLVVGADNRLTENLVIGGALSWGAGWNAGRDDVSGNASGVNSFALTGYGGWSHGALTLNGRVAFGFDHYSQHRTMAYLDETARAGYDGRHYVIAVGGGYDLPLAGSLTLTPDISLRWLRLETDGYMETGAGADGLMIGSGIADQVQSALGAKLSWNVDTSFGLVVPELRVAWLHDFVTAADGTHAVLGGIGFSTSSARIAADGVRIGTGLMYHLSDATMLRLEYDGQFRDDYRAHAGMLQVAIGL